MNTIDISEEQIIIEERGGGSDLKAELAADVRFGLTQPVKILPPKYFYDAQGSRLFEQICELPEYYQTRTERALLEQIAPDIISRYRPESLTEYGSGSSAKTRVLLSAMYDQGVLRRYIPMDVSREILLETAHELVQEYPGLHVRGVIGDFNQGLPAFVSDMPSLIIFLGGTIGNLRLREAIPFLRQTAHSMSDRDLFLLGTDLVKNPHVLNDAYNDSAGVTAEFNLNVLRVINRQLDANFDVERFTHYAFYNPYETRIEMHLVSTQPQRVHIGELHLDVEFEQGETILTEISRKFTRSSVEMMLSQCGLELVEWFTDPENKFALSLIRKVSGSDVPR